MLHTAEFEAQVWKKNFENQKTSLIIEEENRISKAIRKRIENDDGK